MKIWVVCAEAEQAKILSSDDLDQELELVKEHVDPDNLGLELEAVCGTGTIDRLLICGEPWVVNHLCQGLTDQVRSRIVGIIPENLFRRSIEHVRSRSLRAAGNKYLMTA